MKKELASIRVDDFGAAACVAAAAIKFNSEWKFKNEGERQPIDKAKRKKKNKEQRKARAR